MLSRLGLLLFPFVYSLGAVIQLTKDNEHIMAETEVMIVNFYADWCRFSRQLHPIFVNTASLIAECKFQWLSRKFCIL